MRAEFPTWSAISPRQEAWKACPHSKTQASSVMADKQIAHGSVGSGGGGGGGGASTGRASVIFFFGGGGVLYRNTWPSAVFVFPNRLFEIFELHMSNLSAAAPTAQNSSRSSPVLGSYLTIALDRPDLQ